METETIFSKATYDTVDVRGMDSIQNPQHNMAAAILGQHEKKVRREFDSADWMMLESKDKSQRSMDPRFLATGMIDEWVKADGEQQQRGMGKQIVVAEEEDACAKPDVDDDVLTLGHCADHAEHNIIIQEYRCEYVPGTSEKTMSAPRAPTYVVKIPCNNRMGKRARLYV